MSKIICASCGWYIGESELSEKELKKRTKHLPLFCSDECAQEYKNG